MTAPAHTRTLMREVRRGLRTWADALFVWARAEPDARHAALAREIAKALTRITNAMAAWSDDGAVIPGDAHTLPQAAHRPPHDFSA